MTITAKDVIPLSQARSRLSEIADEVKTGLEKIITKNGESYVALIDAEFKAGTFQQDLGLLRRPDPVVAHYLAPQSHFARNVAREFVGS